MNSFDIPPGLVPGLVWLLSAVFATVGLVAIAQGHRAIVRGEASASWPRVPGRIVRNERVERDVEGRGHARPDIAYRYDVAGITLEGSRVAFGLENFFSSRGWGALVRDRYPAGTRVQVAYDPRRPGNAVLESGPPPRAWVPLGLGAVFLLVAGALAMVAASLR